MLGEVHSLYPKVTSFAMLGNGEGRGCSPATEDPEEWRGLLGRHPAVEEEEER